MRLLAAILLSVIGLSGSTPYLVARTEALPHDAYIWQRAWTPHLVTAAHRSADIVRAWRILVAEADRSGHWTAVALPWDQIVATERPIVAVVRIDGRLDDDRIGAMVDWIVARTGIASAAIAAERPDAKLAGIEIDYDCPTSKLPIYTRFLAELRTRLGHSTALSITALPTWMGSAELERLTRNLDEVVLQVHAVDDPRRGLFDPVQAELWVREFGRRVRRPFRVAIPAYDLRVTWRPDGRLASVEGEVPLLSGTIDGRLLGATPDSVLAFLKSLGRAAPEGLTGVTWFRLPTDADSRSWSLQTWREVVAGRLPDIRLNAELVPTDQSDVWTVTLSNIGLADAALPRQVRLDPNCAMADGSNGFRRVAATERIGEPLVLEATGDGRLRAHRKRIIGWARCTQPGRELDVIQ